MYEYQAMAGDALISTQELNELDKDGWELIQIIPHCEGMKGIKSGQFLIYFRRVKKTIIMN